MQNESFELKKELKEAKPQRLLSAECPQRLSIPTRNFVHTTDDRSSKMLVLNNERAESKNKKQPRVLSAETKVKVAKSQYKHLKPDRSMRVSEPFQLSSNRLHNYHSNCSSLTKICKLNLTNLQKWVNRKGKTNTKN